MADGTPDFTDLLDAFESSCPAVSLQQISSGHAANFPLQGSGLHLNNPTTYLPNQNHGLFPQLNQGQSSTAQSQTGQIAQDAGLLNSAFLQTDVAQAQAPNEESFGGGSLGSMFLSSVESLLSDSGSSLGMQIQPPVATVRPVPRKPRQQRSKPSTAHQNRNSNMQQIRATNLTTNSQQFVDVSQAAMQPQNTLPMMSAGLGSNQLGMKISNTAASPPFVPPLDIQTSVPNLVMSGQQKVQQGSFVHPIQSTRQQQPQSVNPPRPLSAASSTSEHLSRPGSVPQPSPSCGSNHSGDPATPLTPQSYNAGTPQSYKPATPQSYNAGTPQSYKPATPLSYKPATPQSYKPATPQSNLNQAQQRQGTGQFEDMHQLQVMPGNADTFVTNQRTNVMFQPQQPSALQPMNSPSDSLNDLPTPVKDVFNTVSTTSESFLTQRTVTIGSQQQVWNQAPAFMAPNALFTSAAQSKQSATPTFMPSDSQLNIPCLDAYVLPVPALPNRTESNVRSESLTSKQNELLEQLSSFGKAKTKTGVPADQSNRNSGFSSEIAGTTSSKYPDLPISDTQKQSVNSDTMNMMDKANSASSATVKELLGTHIQYEAISPVSDYGMSPARKSSLHDDLSENILFSPPKFPVNAELPLPQDIGPSPGDPLTDPVLVYLKHGNEKTVTPKSTNTAAMSSISSSISSHYFSPHVSVGMPANSSSVQSWRNQDTGSAVADQNLRSAQSGYIQTHTMSLPTPSIFTTPSCQPSNSGYTATWSSEMQAATNSTTSMQQASYPLQAKAVESILSKQHRNNYSKLPTQLSPVKQKAPSAVRQVTTSKTQDSKPFGVRRKGSTDASKSLSLKQKKGSSVDEKFGFDSDDDTEPTICLSKVAPKPSKKQNLLSPKPSTANALSGEEFKNKMEYLKQLQQQQAKLLKIQEYQAQHASGAHLQPTSVALSMHRAIASQLPAAKSVTPVDVHRNVPHDVFSAYTTQMQSTFPPFPVSKDSSKVLTKKRPSLELPAPLSLAQPSVSAKVGDASKVHIGSHDIQPSVVATQPPHYINYLPLPVPGSQQSSSTHSEKSVDVGVPPIITAQSRVVGVSVPATTISGPPSNLSNLLYPSCTSSSQISSYNASFLRSDIPPRTTQSIIPTSVPVSLHKEGRSLPVSTTLQSENITSSGVQPFDSSNFDWLHKESASMGIEKPKTTESMPIQTFSITPPRDSTMARISLSAPSRPITATTVANTAVLKTMSSIPEDVPLKQSIHTVHHLQTTKLQSQPAQTSRTPPKENTSVAHEPKHFNAKKHRILEGYPQSSSENYKSSLTSLTTAPSIPPLAATGHSVLDKQRKYSKERANAKPKHRITPKVQAPSLQDSQTPTSDCVVKPINVTSSESNTSKEVGKDNAKDDQAGSMLLLFNSLLKEASQEASKDTMKSTLGPKQDEKPSSKVSVNPPKVVQAVTTVSKAIDTTKLNIISKVTDTKKLNTSSAAPLDSTTKTNVVSVTSSTVSLPLSQNLPQAKKPIKKNRPAAIVPKRRPYPAIDDSQTVVKATCVTTVPTPLPTPVVSLSKPTATSHIAKAPITSTEVSAASTFKPAPVVNKLLTAPKATEALRETACTPPTVTAPKSPLKSTGLPKLRITAFRSSRGTVIHQSSVLGGETESHDSDTSSHRRKKKKKKKRKRKLSSSSNASSVSTAIVKSTAEQTALLAQKAKMNEQITKELDKKAEEILKSVESATAKSQSVNEKLLPQKRKRIKGANSDNVQEKKKPAKRVRTVKAGLKKKPEEKNEEPVIRYQPKSALQTVSSSNGSSTITTKSPVSLPSTFHRAPGKLPLYLSSSEAKSATTVPTIQLVARNTRLIGTPENAKTSQPAKVVSVKFPTSLQSKSFSTHLLPSGVQYIIPTTRTQPRVILPNSTISTPVTVPVSIVSPLLARSLSGGFVPVSVLTTSSPSTSIKQPQLFTVPVTTANAETTPVKVVGTKQNGAKKPLSNSPSAARVLPLTVALPLAKATTKPPGILAKLSTSSITVSGTLTTPRVATKVLSPTAKPMSANTFQSTFLKLISSQNPVPTYVPPSPPHHLKLDLNGSKQHQCLECKDTFTFSDTLEDHYQRRCILIKVRCMQCDKDLIFFNKCKLLLHARQHSDKGGNGMQFNNAHISPLPLAMCKPRSKESLLKSNNPAKYVSNTRRISVISEDEISAGGLSPTFPTMLACTDCNFSGATPEALEEHFQRVSPAASPDKALGPKPSASFSCEVCSVTVPNQCSFNAHMRTHKRARPHTCPECGQTFDNDGLQEHAYSESRREIDFNIHLSIHCFHLSRMSAYKCKLCTSIFKNADLLRRHLEVRHLQTFHKCRDCPMAFKTHENISSHQRAKHKVVTATKVIHKCPLCETVFTDNSTTQQLFLLQKHFEGHMSHPSINITAYKCLFCSNIYERKCLLRDHLKSAHDVTASGEGSNSPGLSKDWNEAKLLVRLDKNDGASVVAGKKRQNVKPIAKDPIMKIAKLQSPDGSMASNLLIASGIIEGSKKNSSNIDFMTMKSTKQPLKLRLKGMGRPGTGNSSMAQTMSSEIEQSNNVGAILRDGKKVYPCGECSKELPSASARLNHIRLKHKGIRTLYCCPHCPSEKIKFAKKISLKRHLKKAHGIEDIGKQDFFTEYVKLPIGQRFDPAIIKQGQHIMQKPESSSSYKGTSSSGGHKVRKKITALARRTNRPARQVRQDLENGRTYIENSDSEVEHILSNSNVDDTEKSDEEEPDFSLLKLPKSYSCAKCDFQSGDRLEFQVHIMEHREDAENEGMLSALQQCSECGLCFASAGSHAKHLFIKHKIKRKRLLEKYDRKLRAEREANGSLPGSVDGNAGSGWQNGPGSTYRHKCTVCYKRFDDDTQLRTHMRNHGLAFVKSKHVS